VFKNIVVWIKGLFTNPVEALKKLWTTLTGGYASIMDFIWSPIKAGIAWVMKLFGWDDAAAATEKFSIKGFILGIFAKIKAWFTNLFSWGKKKGTTAAGDFSLGKMLGDTISGIWKWFKNLLDIDVMAIAKKIPGVGKLISWFSGDPVTEKGVKAATKKHGQTLKGAEAAGLYDQKGALRDSDINKKALTEGVKSGLVQKEMLDAILADKDLSDKDTAFMQKLVEQATKKGSLYVADLGLHERLDKIFPVNAPTGGGIIAAQSMLQSRRTGAGAAGAGMSVVNQSSQSNVTVSESRPLTSPKRQLAYAI
jgi:hypothetical protein